MNVLTIKSDQEEARIALYVDQKLQEEVKWLAHKTLSTTILEKIDFIIKHNIGGIEHLGGLVVYKGPGSFTGLRIGITVGNSLAYGLNIPIVAENGADWEQVGITRLSKGENEEISLPEYGGEANITKPKK